MVDVHRNEFEGFVAAVAGRTPEAMVAGLADADARALALRLGEDRRALARQAQAVAHALVHARGQLAAQEVEAIGWLLKGIAERIEFADDLEVMVDNRFLA